MTEQDQLALRLFYAVREVNGLMQNRLSETLEAWDLTPQQFSVLTCLLYTSPSPRDRG